MPSRTSWRWRPLKKFPTELATIRASLPSGTPIELWWQDEARIGQNTKITRRWARRGSRLRVPKDQRTKSSYTFGAICPARSTGVALVLPRGNNQAMQWHLEEISAQVSRGAHAVLILDQAGWHGSNKLEFPINITLLHVPPRSPELNPVENLWQFLRRESRPLRQDFEQSHRAIVDDHVHRQQRLGP